MTVYKYEYLSFVFEITLRSVRSVGDISHALQHCRANNLHTYTTNTTLGTNTRKKSENISQNLSLSPKFVKMSNFFLKTADYRPIWEKKLLIFTNFGEKDKFWEIFSHYFSQWHHTYPMRPMRPLFSEIDKKSNLFSQNEHFCLKSADCQAIWEKIL